tara:strand:- start:2744 stop:2977 length:234 start_codon:yes stop_codon:yes gene_type:complete
MNKPDALAIEYILNKFIPYLIVFVLLFTGFTLDDFRPWIISGMIFFIDKYAFKIGRSVGEYENNPEFRKQVDDNLEE